MKKAPYRTPKVIISCAITGSIHTPSMSDALPVTPDEIAQSAIEAAEAGAAILHLHARDPRDGRPSASAEVFGQFLPRIKQATDAVVNITTGGGLTMTMDQRLEGAMAARPEMASLNMGSMNFGIFPMAAKDRDWKHDWEKPYLQGTDDFIFRNTFKDIEHILTNLGQAHGTRFEHECYDVGHLYNVAHFVDRGLLKPPFFVQMIFGILGGIGAAPENLIFMKETADKLFGDDYRWSVLGAGRHQMPLITQAAMMGGNVRVGLEDNLYIGAGQLARSNAEQVAKIRRIIEELGLAIATPDEAREILALKGGDKVGF
ncbi:3-keto-5-aminohexanoate cleavage protein [Paracoccus marinus]|uniref:3-keto-5-aminohexanoate cleavage protein n=1 Tax=Paracoccus marinus TaxID=288426 RepID=UPI00103ADFAC|nr:3-keto-5-aminohexanoate cleavage protein [Paracoccus marinus]GLS80343.1 3-keto-5-aminohexanoate cleavage protein [Paracoccus marinus]